MGIILHIQEKQIYRIPISEYTGKKYKKEKKFMKAIYTYKENEKFYVKFFTRKLQITGKEYTTVNSILNKFKNEKQKKRFIKAKN